MKYTPKRLLGALYRRLFVIPRGGGRPVPKEAFDNEYSSGSWDHFTSWDELPRYLVLAGAVRHYYPRPAILDVGCGAGDLARHIANQPFESYLGIDLSSEGIRRARALGLAAMEFQEGNFEDWTTQARFDAVIFQECIGYAADPGRTVERFASFLRPGGRLFLSQYRFGGEGPIWRRIGKVAGQEAATSVMSEAGKVWDIKVYGEGPGRSP